MNCPFNYEEYEIIHEDMYKTAGVSKQATDIQSNGSKTRNINNTSHILKPQEQAVRLSVAFPQECVGGPKNLSVTRVTRKTHQWDRI